MEPLIKILSASVELFRQYGFKTITMDDIARRAGISKKTLYQQFANKNEVVMESVQWYKNKLTEQCDHIIKNSTDAIEAMVETSLMLDNAYKQMNPMALFELQRYFPEAHDLFRKDLLLRDIDMIKNNIVRGIQEGLYREELNAELMARLRLEISLMMCQPNLMIGDRNELLYVSHELVEHYLYGLMTRKGQELYTKKYKQVLNQVSK
jgi:AcrR family transcriptional regulator